MFISPTSQRRRMGAPVRVDDLAATVNGAPEIAVNASGNAYVVWQDYRNGHPDIYFAYRPANGSWGASRRINIDTETAVRDPAIGIDDAGIVPIAWTDDATATTTSTSPAGTATGGWSQEIRLNDDTSTVEHITPDLAVDSAGNVDVVWADGRNGEYDDIYTVRRSTTGAWSANELMAAHDLYYPQTCTIQPSARTLPDMRMRVGQPTILGRAASPPLVDSLARPAACGVHSGVSLLGGKGYWTSQWTQMNSDTSP